MNITCIKRLAVGIFFGLVSGIVFTQAVATMVNPVAASMTEPLFWFIVLTQLYMGVFIALVGDSTHHPLLGFRIHWSLRGTKIGIMMALLVGLMLNGPDYWPTVLAMVIMGAVAGLVTDAAATVLVSKTHQRDSERMD